MPSSDAPVAVVLTPPGRGAVAVVLVAGLRSTEIVADAFYSVSGRSLADLPPGSICYGHWGSAQGEDVIVIRKPAPNDALGPQVEVHCHGGTAAIRAVVDMLESAGCTQLSWQQWIDLAEPDPIRAAASKALAQATTTRVAGILLDQYHGALRCEVESVLADLACAHPDRAAKRLADLLQPGNLGRHLTQPWRVVLAGPPNVGKSSLINALVGFERAIVSPTPGTTRDVVTATTAIDGWPVELTDTAGLRTSDDELERAGVRLASEICRSADLLILVADAGNTGEPRPATLPPIEAPILAVLNKIDLQPGAFQSSPAESANSPIRTSTLTGEGIAELVEAIGRGVVPHPPSPGAAVAFTPRQREALERARQDVQRGAASTAVAELHALLAPASSPGGLG